MKASAAVVGLLAATLWQAATAQNAPALDDTAGFRCYMPYPQKKPACDD